MKEYQTPVTKIVEFHLKHGCLKDRWDGVPYGSYAVDRLEPDPNIEEIGGDEAKTYHMTLWEE